MKRLNPIYKLQSIIVSKSLKFSQGNTCENLAENGPKIRKTVPASKYNIKLVIYFMIER